MVAIANAMVEESEIEQGEADEPAERAEQETEVRRIRICCESWRS